MEYILCQGNMFIKNKGVEPDAEDWIKCAIEGISAEVIRTCKEGTEGRKPLEHSYAEAHALQLTGPPRRLTNHRSEVAPSSADGLKTAFCAENTGLPEFSEPLSVEETFREYCSGLPDKKAERGPLPPNTPSAVGTVPRS